MELSVRKISITSQLLKIRPESKVAPKVAFKKYLLSYPSGFHKKPVSTNFIEFIHYLFGLLYNKRTQNSLKYKILQIWIGTV